jgi:hypothetical protein
MVGTVLASGIIGTIISDVDSAIASPSVDVVGIYDQNFNQLFSGVRPIKAKVNPEAKLMEHPIETGATITDHRVFLPIEIELNCVFTAVTYMQDYQSVVAAFNSDDTLIVQTRTDTYKNMVIKSIPHEESPDLGDTISMILSLRQVTIVSSQSSAVSSTTKPASAVNRATVKTGAQQGTPATTTQTNTLQSGSGAGGSTLYGWFHKDI